MKKLISLCLCLASLFSFASCKSGMPSQTTAEEISDSVYYPYTSTFAETPTRLLYVKAGTIYYYNKLTDEHFRFCFDPLCKHGSFEECISEKFMMAYGTMQSIKYCEYDNRFYALRGEQFCSFSFDGSDLRIVHSFGEVGAFDSNPHGAYMPSGTAYLHTYGEYVYFLARDSQSGKFKLMCYNAKDQKLHSIFEDGETNVDGYLLGETEIYLSLSGACTGVYRIHFDGSELTQITDAPYTYPYWRQGIFDGETVYFVKGGMVDAGKYVCMGIAAYQPKTNTFTDILPAENNRWHVLLAVTEDYIYYVEEEAVSIGFYVSPNFKDEIFNRYSKIYRLDKKSGEIVTVLDDITCETENLYFVGDTAIIYGKHCVPHETRAADYEGVFTATVDENGMFTDLKLSD